MTKNFARLGTLVVAFAVILPFQAGAQSPLLDAGKPKAAPAPAARPAPAPAARPAPPRPAQAGPLIAPHQAPAARPAPPPAAARVAPPRPASPGPLLGPSHAPAPAAGGIAPRPDRNRAAERSRQPGPLINRAQGNAPAQNATPNATRRAGAPGLLNGSQPRQERLLQRREDRALRALPPAQRAARREEILRAREQRATQRAVIQPNGQRTLSGLPNAGAAPNARGLAAVNRGPRRNGQARITPQAARQGRFAGPLIAQAMGNNRAQFGAQRVRAGRYAPRRAWQSGLRAAFVPWYGPVFWPYAYTDIFDYTFWPAGYDDGYWDYAYDDFFDGVFYGEVGPPAEYVGPVEDAPRAVAPSYTAVRNLCAQPGSGITAWPTAEIESKVGLTRDQIQLLGDVKSAGTKAAAVFKATCPSENAFPLTPPGRLASMMARLDATLTAVQTVRPALETFYGSLSDEQKERFNTLGPAKTAANAETREALPDDAKKCGEAKPGLTNLPIEQIEDVIAPNDAQQAELDKLGEATVKAVGVLQGACPAQTPLTPPGRLQAIETRLTAMLEAARTVKPALDGFYASLNVEQKARFNRLGRELTQNTTSNQ